MVTVAFLATERSLHNRSLVLHVCIVDDLSHCVMYVFAVKV